MLKIGVTGHRLLTEKIAAYADQWITGFLSGRDTDIIGMTSLADGADQLFARAVLQRGGTLQAVIPARDYAGTIIDRASYYDLIAAATTVTELDYDHALPTAYMAAGKYIVDNSDVVVAIWDGNPGRGPGGTADAVAYARQVGRQVHVCWPPGVARPTYPR
ncbi:hypothetical protein [Actinocrispum wychmicini]|uniref:DNA recombination-mediator protein A n=1 Tax=Actinocrispum wychmicini TaxID=1213861 RepID=A0A4R2J3A4_9PSEU|nr:hypothetical protein [Actinocrispum wychmicini]TCO52951.1 hypothetical protein EV192_111145 [Actinocrispum wychmicini]